MIAVHFGAGNIGRGFIGCLLNEAGYNLVFLDVNQEIVDELNSHDSYRVIETGAGAKTHTVSGFSALNSQSQFDEAAEVIASAQLLTASVGVNVLKFLAPLIAAGLEKRQGEPLVIMACENAIGATDILRGEMQFRGFVFSDYTADEELVAHLRDREGGAGERGELALLHQLEDALRFIQLSQSRPAGICSVNCNTDARARRAAATIWSI